MGRGVFVFGKGGSPHSEGQYLSTLQIPKETFETLTNIDFIGGFPLFLKRKLSLPMPNFYGIALN